jgi:hypothetical protein
MNAIQIAKEALRDICKGYLDGSVSADIAEKALAAIEAEQTSDGIEGLIRELHYLEPLSHCSDPSCSVCPQHHAEAIAIIQSFADTQVAKERERLEELAGSVSSLIETIKFVGWSNIDPTRTLSGLEKALAKYQEEGE